MRCEELANLLLLVGKPQLSEEIMETMDCGFHFKRLIGDA